MQKKIFFTDCLSFDTSYADFGDFRDIDNIATAETCQDECAADDECKIWEWVDINAYFNPPKDGKKGKCVLKNGKGQGGIIRTATESEKK